MNGNAAYSQRYWPWNAACAATRLVSINKAHTTSRIGFVASSSDFGKETSAPYTPAPAKSVWPTALAKRSPKGGTDGRPLCGIIHPSRGFLSLQGFLKLSNPHPQRRNLFRQLDAPVQVLTVQCRQHLRVNILLSHSPTP